MASLVITADDFGLHLEIDEAIIELATLGIVRRTSVLVTSPNFSKERLARFVAAGGTLNLHSAFVEMPALRPELFPKWWIENDGTFIAHWHDWVQRAPFHRFPSRSVKQELSAQVVLLKTILAELQISDSVFLGIDSHQNFHLFPPFAAAYRQILNEHSHLKIRSFVDSGKILSPLRSAILFLGKRLYPADRIIPTVGIHHSGHLTLPAAQRVLSDAPKLDEVHLMTHPGKTRVLSNLKSFHPAYSLDWKTEFELLKSEEFRLAVRNADLREVDETQ